MEKHLIKHDKNPTLHTLSHLSPLKIHLNVFFNYTVKTQHNTDTTMIDFVGYMRVETKDKLQSICNTTPLMHNLLAKP